MPTLFKQLPWSGGLNTIQDEGMVAPSQLTVSDNEQYDDRPGHHKRDGINHNWDGSATSAVNLIGLHDYWYGTSTRTQRIVSVASDGSVYSYNGGVRTKLTVSGTAWTGTLTSAIMVTFNSKVFIAVSGVGNVMKYWDGSSAVQDVPGSPPDASIISVHQGRLVCNSKTNPDSLYYCETANHTQWMGIGDSGAIPIQPGDGDPIGINGIFPTFKGDLFVAKKTKLYRLTGLLAECDIATASSVLGTESHRSIVAIGTDDVMWLSEKGYHSINAVMTYGDFTTVDVSGDIQRTFNQTLVRSRFMYACAGYVPQHNSLAIGITEASGRNRINTTSGVNNAVYLYNLAQKTWYRWPDLGCQSLCVAEDGDKKRIYLGTHRGRVSQTQAGTIYDTDTSGNKVAIKRTISTGVIYLDDNPYTKKRCLRFILYYRPKGRHMVNVNITLDDVPLSPENSLSFSGTVSAAPLGAGFKLGATALGTAGSFGAYDRAITGTGHGCKITIVEQDLNSNVEIQGWALEYDLADQSGLGG